MMAHVYSCSAAHALRPSSSPREIEYGKFLRWYIIRSRVFGGLSGSPTPSPDFFDMPSRVKLLICLLPAAVLANDESPGVEKILSDVDTDKDGKVSLDELAARLLKVRELQIVKEFGMKNEYILMSGEHDENDPDAEEEIALARDNFAHEFDTLDGKHDNDGYLSEDEVMAEMKEHYADMMAEKMATTDEGLEGEYEEAALEMERLKFRAADADADGKLDKVEYVAMMTRTWRNVEVAMAPTYARLDAKVMLKQHDRDHSKDLDKEEVTHAHDEEYVWYDTHPPHLRDEL